MLRVQRKTLVIKMQQKTSLLVLEGQLSSF